MDRAKAQKINAIVKRHMDAAAVELGDVIIGKTGCRYDDISCTIKVEFIPAPLKANGETDKDAVERARFNEVAWRFNLSEKDFHAKFRLNGKIYTLVGLNPRAPEYPVLGRNAEGKTYRFQYDVLKYRIADHE